MARKMNRNMSRAAGIAAAACVAAANVASAAVWVPTAGATNYAWNANANWDTGAFPNAAGAVADVNNNIAGNQTISLQQGVTLGTLNLGDADGTHAFTIAAGTPNTNALTFDSGAAGVPAELNVRNEGTSANSIGAPILLSSDLNINLAPTTVNGNRQSLNVTGNVTTTGRTVTVTGGFRRAVGTDTDGTQMTFGGADTLIGNGTIVNNSDSPLVITGNKASFTGTLVANGQGVGSDGNTGTITLTAASVRNAAEIIVNGYHNGVADQGGKLQIGTGGTGAVPVGQRLTQNRVTMNGGLLNDGGVPLAAGNTAVLQADTVANFDFQSGFALVNVTASGTTAGNVLTATTVERGAGATAFFRAAAPTTGTGGQAVVSQMKAGNGADLVVGSTAASGTNTRVIPWMVARASASNLGIESFATYDAAEGFRVLRTGEFSTTFATGANVVAGNISNLAQDWTINSLFHNSSGVQNPNVVGGPVRTITIASGGVAFSLNGGGIGAAGNADGRAGVVNFGAAEGVVSNGAGNTNSIGSVIAGSGGLTKGGFGTLVITGANTYAGKTHVSGGTLQVGNGTFGSALGDDDVTVHAGAVLDIRGSTADATAATVDVIDDDEALALLAYGLFNGKVSIAGGLVETVGELLLGDVVQAGGYYGSSSAAAANAGRTVNVNNAYFAGDGLIYVAAVPEPGTAGVLAVAGLALAARRRRR